MLLKRLQDLQRKTTKEQGLRMFCIDSVKLKEMIILGTERNIIHDCIQCVNRQYNKNF